MQTAQMNSSSAIQIRNTGINQIGRFLYQNIFQRLQRGNGIVDFQRAAYER